MISMRSRSRTSILTAAGAAVLSLSLLTGCAAMSSGSSDSSAPAGGAEPQMAQDGSSYQEGSDPTAITDRALVTTGELGLTTTDVAAAAATTEDLVASLDGRIDSRSERTGDRTTTTLTIRVPADYYESLIEQLRGVGTVQYVTTNVEDVTMITVDLDARIDSLEASVASLRAMLEQATSVEDMLEVESTLSEREAELQSLRAQQTALADQVAMSTLTVTISNDELANPTPDNTGFLGGLQAGWNTMVGFFGSLLTVLGFMLPGLIVLAIIAAIVVIIVRTALRRRRARRAYAPTQPRPPAQPRPGTEQAQQAPPVHLDAGAAQQHNAPPPTAAAAQHNAPPPTAARPETTDPAAEDRGRA